MSNFSGDLSEKLDSFVDDFLSVLDLSNRSKSEREKIRIFTENALSDKVSLFILKNLRGEQLDQYEELIMNRDVDLLKIKDFLEKNIKNYKNRLEDYLKEFQQEIAEKISHR